MLFSSLQNLHPSHTDVILKQSMLGSAIDFLPNLASWDSWLGSVLHIWKAIFHCISCSLYVHTPTVSTTPDIVSSSLSSPHPLRIFSHSFTNSETLCEVSAWSVAFKWVTFGQMLCGCWLEAPGTVVQPFRQNWRSHPLFFFFFFISSCISDKAEVKSWWQPP